MPLAGKKVALCLLAKDCKTWTHGFLSMTNAKYKNGMEWRAVLRVVGEEKRDYGTRHEDPYESARKKMENLGPRITSAEKKRVLDMAKDLWVKRRNGSPPRHGSQRGSVTIIHQIYGVYRDGQEMPQMFVDSHWRWREVARELGATYHMWSADEVDALIKQHYHHLWDTYKGVPFAIMRADMARIAILHRYGGMYVDLDVFPNTNVFPQVEFAVQKAYTCGYNTARAKRRASQKKNSVYDKASSIDIEVIIARRDNPVLIRWLIFMKRQIVERDYASCPKKWGNRAMRYILSTTGPWCFQRFLRLPSNTELRRTMHYVSSNNFAHGKGLCAKERLNFEVLSYESNSYYVQKKAPFETPTGDGDCPLPVLNGECSRSVLCRRITSKRRLVDQDVVMFGSVGAQPGPCHRRRLTSKCSLVEEECTSPGKRVRVRQECAPPVKRARWKRNTLTADMICEVERESQEDLNIRVEMMSETEEEELLQQKGDAVVDSVEHASQDALNTMPVSNAFGSPPSPVINSMSQLEDTNTSTMNNQVQHLRQHLHEWRKCAGVSMVMQDFPPELQRWLQEGYDWRPGFQSK